MEFMENVKKPDVNEKLITNFKNINALSYLNLL